MGVYHSPSSSAEIKTAHICIHAHSPSWSSQRVFCIYYWRHLVFRRNVVFFLLFFFLYLHLFSLLFFFYFSFFLLFLVLDPRALKMKLVTYFETSGKNNPTTERCILEFLNPVLRIPFWQWCRARLSRLNVCHIIQARRTLNVCVLNVIFFLFA